jgi:hypothetical protein
LALKIVQGTYVHIPKQYSEELSKLIKWMLQTKESNRPSINQIILSSIISTRINKFVSESQQMKPKSYVIHEPLLKPPPDLLALERL